VRQVGLVVMSLLILGCTSTAPMMSVNKVQVALLLGDIKAQYIRVSVLLSQACSEKKLDEATCKALVDTSKEAIILEKTVRKSLLAPPSDQLDMEQFSEYLGVLMKLAGKAAL